MVQYSLTVDATTSTPRDVLAPPAYAACAAAKGVVEAMTRIVARELRGRVFSRVGFQRRSTWGLQMPAGARVAWKQRWPSLREARPGGGRGKTIISFTSSGGSGLAAEQPPSAAERTTMLISGGFE